MGALIPMPSAPSQHKTLAPSGFDDPFAMLDACHERVHRMLALLQRLQAHLEREGCDKQAQNAARDILRYFEQAAPHHHLDEERHLVPVLRACGADSDHALADRMLGQHVEMATQWADLRRVLLSLADADPAVSHLDAARVQAFVRLYQDHIALEDEHIYPRCRSVMDAAALASAGDEMARRRGVPTAAPAV